MRKEELKEGAILPIYTNFKDQEGFKGMACLIKQDESSIRSQYTNHYVKTETDQRDPCSRFIPEQNIFFEGKAYLVDKVEPDCITVHCKYRPHAKIDIYYPFEGVVDLFTIGESITLEEDSYRKVYRVIEDCPEFVKLVTYAKYMNPAHKSDTLTIEKPFFFKRELREPNTTIWKFERWVVNYLGNPFYGRLRKGQQIWYMDHGLYKIAYLQNGKIYLEGKYDKDKLIEVGTEHLYADNVITHRGHAWIAYFYSTASYLPETEEVKDEEKIDWFEIEEDDEA